MSAKDKISGSMMSALMQVLPDSYEILNPVSQFLCDEIDKVFEDTKLSRIIKAQAVNKANSDPNGVLASLVTAYNDGVLVGFHRDIGDFVRSLNEAEGETE